MKYSTTLLCALFIVLFACKKKEEPLPALDPIYMGEATGLKNGKPWQSYSRLFLSYGNNPKYALEFDSLYYNSYLLETLSFSNFSLQPDTCRLFRSNSENLKNRGDSVLTALSYLEHDVTIGSYQLCESANNQLIIESYDTVTQQMKGRFELTFIVAERPYPSEPDTVRYTNGRFDARLYKR
jgi:hypothetical protein